MASSGGIKESEPTATMVGATPRFDFTITDPDIAAHFGVPMHTYLEQHQSAYDAIASGVIVFDRPRPTEQPRPATVLLLQRAASDSMPNRWEIPGGGVDREDETILHGATREVREEAGLVVSSFVGRCVPSGENHRWLQQGAPHPGTVFFTRSGLRVCKFTFIAEVASPQEVVLNEDEHQRYVWATEEECVRGKKGNIELEFTTTAQRETILEAWKMLREGRKEEQ